MDFIEDEVQNDKNPYYFWHLGYVITEVDYSSLLTEEELARLGVAAVYICKKAVEMYNPKNSWNSQIPNFFRYHLSSLTILFHRMEGSNK